MTPTRQITGSMVLAGMIAFFALIFAVNGVFVYFALDTWPGLSSTKSYDKGVRFNAVLEAAEAQSKLGWSSRLALAPAGAESLNLGVTMADKAGGGLPGLTVTVDLIRPAQEGLDQKLVLKETAAGRYSVRFSRPTSGRWYAIIQARSTRGETYKMQHELTVDP